MLWLKRNLDLVIAIVVGVVLAALGGVIVWNKMGENRQLDEDLGAAKRRLEELTTGGRVSATPENVRAANRDLDEARKYAEEAKQLFAPTPTTPLDKQTYLRLLQNEIAKLQRLAAAASVEVGTTGSNYNFSFEGQIRQVNFNPNTLRPLSEQLTEIKTLCEAMFKARIQRLVSIQRIAVSEHDSGNSTEILPGTFETKGGMTAWPYEFTIECFSSSLGRVLSELTQIPRVVIVKTIEVEPSSTGPQPRGVSAASDPGQPPPPGAPPRPFRGGRLAPGMPPPAPVVPAGGVAAARPPELRSVLEEHQLHVTLLIHVVKPAVQEPPPTTGRRR
ncbi:MAG: hypothetical protein HZA90_22145 [Verrucomicrobia bacterium]|nr:hypothetical protein [Verrucomicrobiota bacterium]